jgi:hypothetical protein
MVDVFVNVGEFVDVKVLVGVGVGVEQIVVKAEATIM